MKHTLFSKCALPMLGSLLLSGLSEADLLIHYPFDIDSGTTVPNRGTLDAGSFAGEITYAPGKDDSFGTAFSGNRLGLNNSRVETGATGDELGMGAGGVYTAMAWINWTGGSGNVDHMVFGQLDGPGNNNQLHHGIRDDGEVNIHFGGWGGDQDIADAGTVAPDTWTHVAWQYDGADKVVYVDGVEITRAPGNNITDPTLEVIIGGHGRDPAPEPVNSFNGLIDEVKIFDEALTAEQITAEMVPVADADFDGLTDAEEVDVYETDPNNPDSDGDGMGDGVEVANMLDPNSAEGDDGAEGDPDGDELGNLVEIDTHKTDPQEADTDSDDLDDGAEISVHMTNPILADSDGDNLTDGDEVNIHKTNPNSVDSDSDLYNDDVEIAAGSDPNDPNSTPVSQPLPEPLLYYTFDISNGTVVENLGSLVTAGNLVGGATYGDSNGPEFGTAFYGNRAEANDARVETTFTGDDLGMGAGAVYTAMAWINWAGGSGNVDHMVFGQLDGEGNNPQLHHGIRDDSEVNIHFGGWGGAQDISDAGTVPPDTWTHVTWQYDGVDKVVYVDGVETSRAAGNNITNPALEVIIGGHGRDPAPEPINSFNGAIDEVKIYDAVLDALQIIDAMAPGGGGAAELQITDITYDTEDNSVTLTFTSSPGRSYSILWSPDLLGGPDYIEVDDSVDADPAEDMTTVTIDMPDLDPGPDGNGPLKAFFFVRRN